MSSVRNVDIFIKNKQIQYFFYFRSNIKVQWICNLNRELQDVKPPELGIFQSMINQKIWPIFLEFNFFDAVFSVTQYYISTYNNVDNSIRDDNNDNSDDSDGDDNNKQIYLIPQRQFFKNSNFSIFAFVNHMTTYLLVITEGATARRNRVEPIKESIRPATHVKWKIK